ncbi:unnamed protein product [Brassica rapa]|uniref:F-box domain-containing protein n=1 Tax=Brassica campestris TaxID=3711 RepID=A0A3P5ZQE6_BRACM|nr:unnamed protein product [Brassica rapa]VDC80299.1 unnamed protein product [Brassica rapa]
MNRGRRYLKQAASEQDFTLEECQSIAQVISLRGSNQIAVRNVTKKEEDIRRRYMSEIPLDLLVEILIKLPGKYLARLNCVSKQWSSLISSRYFCDSLTRRKQQQQPRLYMCLVDEGGQRALLSIASTSPDNTSFVVDQDLSIQGMGGYYLNDLHGLMCFSMGKTACIYNPSTGQRLTLPKIKPDT